MKKKLIPLLGLCLMMMLLTTGAAYAAKISDATSAKAGVSVTVLDSKEGVNVTYSAAVDGSQYLIIVLNDDNKTPTKSNIVYMNQTDGAGAAGGKAEFATVLPSTAAEGKTCHVFLSSNASTGIGSEKYEEVGTFTVSGGTGGNVRYLGDVNNDDDINIQDVIKLLNICINDTKLDGIEFKVANVKSDDEDINIQDVMRLLNMVIADEAKQAVS